MPDKAAAKPCNEVNAGDERPADGAARHRRKRGTAPVPSQRQQRREWMPREQARTMSGTGNENGNVDGQPEENATRGARN